MTRAPVHSDLTDEIIALIREWETPLNIDQISDCLADASDEIENQFIAAEDAPYARADHLHQQHKEALI
ncbi:MAG: hypothetical protein ACU0CA_14300 [Paracoccaceae bacterium]